MRLIHFLLVLLTSFLGPGSAAEPTQTDTNRVVTQIQVTTVHDGQSIAKTYTGNDELESILTYLRLTAPTAKIEYEPDSFRSDSYTFILFYSDGNHTTYRQIYHDYLQKDSGPWQRIDAKAGLHFPPI